MKRRPTAWRWRPIDLGWSVVERDDAAVYLALHLADGGGFVRSIGVWRIGEKRDCVLIVDAADA